MKQYIVDAFTDRAFHGNPAAICVMDQWPNEQLMMDIAMENNLSETAFIVKEEDIYHLRWFTPTCEVGLCGHATLASGFTILNFYDKDSDKVTFKTLAGNLTVSRSNGMYELLFPNIPLQPLEITEDIVAALGCVPEEVVMGKELDLICVLQDTNQVKDFVPNAELIKKLPGRMLHITAPGIGQYDCCSRCFGPKIGILEDPVCGSAHCQIIPYWAKRLGKSTIDAWEASLRGGALQGEILNDEQLIIRGNATLFAESDLRIS